MTAYHALDSTTMMARPTMLIERVFSSQIHPGPHYLVTIFTGLRTRNARDEVGSYPRSFTLARAVMDDYGFPVLTTGWM